MEYHNELLFALYIYKQIAYFNVRYIIMRYAVRLPAAGIHCAYYHHLLLPFDILRESRLLFVQICGKTICICTSFLTSETLYLLYMLLRFQFRVALIDCKQVYCSLNQSCICLYYTVAHVHTMLIIENNNYSFFRNGWKEMLVEDIP